MPLFNRVLTGIDLGSLGIMIVKECHLVVPDSFLGTCKIQEIDMLKRPPTHPAEKGQRALTASLEKAQ